MAENMTHEARMAILRKRYHENKNQKTIARELGCTQATVSRLLERFIAEGDVSRRNAPGRPPVVDDDVKESVENTIRRKRHATGAELAAAVEDDTGRRVSRRTMSRVRRQLAYRPVHVSQKPSLTAAHKAARLAWCRAHMSDRLGMLVFMDECGVTIDYHRRIHWIKPGELRPVRETLPSRVRLNVWAAIWRDAKTDLYITTNNFDSAKYIGVLDETLAPALPLGRKRFIQDGVPFHWTRAVMDWFEGHAVRLVEDFPAKSPDLNAIEYVWGWMKHTVAGHEPHDAATLEEALRDAWDNLSQTTIRHFIDHIGSVMREIIAAQGGNSH
jgi:transposase